MISNIILKYYKRLSLESTFTRVNYEEEVFVIEILCCTFIFWEVSNGVPGLEIFQRYGSRWVGSRLLKYFAAEREKNGKGSLQEMVRSGLIVFYFGT
jgi:hypothetical protein